MAVEVAGRPDESVGHARQAESLLYGEFLRVFDVRAVALARDVRVAVDSVEA